MYVHPAGIAMQVWFIVAAAEQAEVLRRKRLYLRCVLFDKVLTLNFLNLLSLILSRSNLGYALVWSTVVLTS